MVFSTSILGGGFVSIVEMQMVNLVGITSDFDELTKKLAIDGCMQPVNALKEINSSDFMLKTSVDNIEVLMDVNYIRPYLYDKDYNISLKHMEELLEAQKIFGISHEYAKDAILDFETSEKKLLEVYNKYKVLKKKFEELEAKDRYLKSTYVALEFLKDIDLPMDEITNMRNFQINLYKVSEQNMAKLKANYENIPSIIKPIYTSEYAQKGIVIFISFTPLLLLKIGRAHV